MEKETPRESRTGWLIPAALILGLVLLLGLPVERLGQEAPAHSPLDSWLKLLVGYFAAVAEISAALVIGIAVLRGLVTYFRRLIVHPETQTDASEAIRLQLGRALALGLEFTVASDILHTAVAPTRQDILNLGAIVLLRSLLNYFLEREISQGEARKSLESNESARSGAEG